MTLEERINRLEDVIKSLLGELESQTTDEKHGHYHIVDDDTVKRIRKLWDRMEET